MLFQPRVTDFGVVFTNTRVTSAVKTALRIASTNLGALIKSAGENVKDGPLVPLKEWEMPGCSDLATHR